MIREHPLGRLLLPIFVIAVTVFLAHFARFPEFGLYGDDYWSIAPHLNGSVKYLWGWLVFCFTYWPTGRPLNHFLPNALSIIGSGIGGLEGIYVLAAAWLALNGGLVFLIVSRIMSDRAAIIAALVYVLFPAVSTKIWLTHASHVEGAMTFLLLGIWLWLSGGRYRTASYPTAALALLSYETAFLPFLAVPMLWAGDRRTTIRTWALHVVLCVGIVAPIAVIRLSTGDVRATEALLSPGQVAYRSATSLFLGPLTSARSFLVAPITGWYHLDAFAVFAAALIITGIGAVWWLGQPHGESTVERTQAIWPDWLRQPAPHANGLPWWWVLIGAIIVLSGSYALTLTNYPPTQTVGPLTSTHVAAGWPACLALAALSEGARQRGCWCSKLVAGLFLVWLTCVIGYHHYIQREYVRAWNLQKNFWRQVTALAPEVDLGWTVIVDGPPAEGSPVMWSNSWADYHAYRLIFTTGLDPRGPAFGHLGYLRGYIQFRLANNQIEWRPTFWRGPFVPIDPTRLVLLTDDRGTLRRVPELSTPVGKLVSATVLPAAPRVHWPSTPVSRLLFPDRFPRPPSIPSHSAGLWLWASRAR